MKTMNININQAKLLSYSVDLNDEKPEVSATIGLYAGTKQISQFSLRTQSFYSNSVEFDIPASMIEPILEIAREIETIMVRTCTIAMAELPEPK